jgi:hypothetical protein
MNTKKQEEKEQEQEQGWVIFTPAQHYTGQVAGGIQIDNGVGWCPLEERATARRLEVDFNYTLLLGTRADYENAVAAQPPAPTNRTMLENLSMPGPIGR